MYSPRRSPAVGAMFGTPDSHRRSDKGQPAHLLHKEEAAALGHFALPASILSSPQQREQRLSHEFNAKQRDEPSVSSVHEAMEIAPNQAPIGGRGGPPRMGVVLQSPRRISVLGETQRHASQWRQEPTFTLKTPYPVATEESRFADAEADKAALAAVAHTAGRSPAAPPAGMTTNRQATMDHLPSMRRQMMNPGQH
jgi:hypothetical protein